jgi:plastocyanin
MNMKNVNRSILMVTILCAALFANACGANKTIATITTSVTASVCLTTAGNATVNITNNEFQPQMMTARVGTTVTFNNTMGPLTLVGNSGFTMGSFGGMMMQTGGSYQYTFSSPGVYVVSASGQSFICTITVVS